MTENRNRHLVAKHAGSAPRRMRGRVEFCAVAALFLLVVLAALAPKIRAQSTNKATNQSTNGATNKDFEWPTYSADLAGTRYRPLDQIDASNFNKLEVAWMFKTDNLGPTPEFRLEGTPLMVGGVVYATAGTRKAVVALDATTGELLWMHSINEGERAAVDWPTGAMVKKRACCM
jgi:quinoprotein glucose dehydrogenase